MKAADLYYYYYSSGAIELRDALSFASAAEKDTEVSFHEEIFYINVTLDKIL